MEKVRVEDSLRGTGIELSRYRSVERAHSLFEVMRGSIYTNGSWRRAKTMAKIMAKILAKMIAKMIAKIMAKILAKILAKIK